MLDSRGRKE